MSISASDVKALREKTGAGMMDCKKALAENNGDMEASVDWLRKKGIAAAGKKAGRAAAEGLVAIATNDKKGVLVELNSETDFVAKNEKFQNLASEIAEVALAGDAEINKLKQSELPSAKKSIEDAVTEAVGVIGENIQLRRSAEIEGDIVVSYLHNAIKENLGKIGVLVSLSSSGDVEKVKAFGKQVAMHVAAIKPESLDVASLDQSIVERERQVLTEQAKESGKPENVIEKMIEGRIKKFYSEVVLLEQAFVIDGKTPVKEALAEAGKDAGGEITINSFKRFTLGEGVDKKEENFADEVAKVAGN